MMLLFRVILLFLVLFNARLPIFYNSGVLSMVLATIYYIFRRRAIPVQYFFFKYVVRIFVALVFVILITFLITSFHHVFDYNLVKIFTFELFLLVSFVYILPILLNGKEEIAVEYAACLLCYVFALQGLIQLLGFAVSPIGNFLLSLQPDVIENLVKTDLVDTQFRGYSFGNGFFGLASGYGFAFAAMFRVLFAENRKLLTGYQVYVVFFLMFCGAAFTGRTAWLGLLIALGMQLVLLMITKSHIKIKILLSILLLPIMGYFIFAFLLPSSLQYKFYTQVFPFAFEFYYNYIDYGQLTTQSSDYIIENFYYAISNETLISGDGQFLNADGSYYGHTDAGYMRIALYGGIGYSLCLMIYQWLFVLNPLRIAWRRWNLDDKKDIVLFLTLMILFYVFEYKGTSIGVSFLCVEIVFFLGIAYMIKYYKDEDSLLDSGNI